MQFLKTFGRWGLTALLLTLCLGLIGSGVRSETAVASAAYQQYLPLVFTPPLDAPFDLTQFLIGDQRLYEVQHSSGSQARHQTQLEQAFFFHTKGHEVHAEWEELWYDERYIYRGTDTSPGNGLYYTLRDPGLYGSRWAPRYWEVGMVFERNPLVTFYDKDSCNVAVTGTQRSWLKFEAYYPRYTFDNGVTLRNVIQLAWLLEPDGAAEERYFYAEQYGFVGWASRTNGFSQISEIHSPGARPNNNREEIGCLDTSAAASEARAWPVLPYWPGNHRR